MYKKHPLGTGASCVYPLIAAKKNKWHFLASEVDKMNFQYAQRNVERNKEMDRINGMLYFPTVILTIFSSFRVLLDPGGYIGSCM